MMFKYIIIKMWAEYNLAMHPVVEVSMKGVIKNDEDFDDFTKNWVELYERKQDFVFVFDTREVGWVSPRYAFKMANFISQLKKRERQYLKRSSIIVDSWWVKGLLKLIFAIQSPVCPIYYHPDTNDLILDTLLCDANGNITGEALRSYERSTTKDNLDQRNVDTKKES